MNDSAKRLAELRSDCVICGPWPAADRELMRRFCCIAIPLTETVCDECISAFFVYMAEDRDSFYRPRRRHRRH